MHEAALRAMKQSLTASFAIFLLFKNAFMGLPSFHSGYPAFWAKKMAEEEGFEPSVSFPTAVFKTAALNHSTIPPVCYYV